MEMNNTYKYLEGVEIKLVKEMQAILTQKKRNASHSLYNSIEGEIEKSSKGFLFKISYARHGDFVLDDKRNVIHNASKNAIQSIMDWILNKGVSIGKGKIRTPLKKEGSKTGLEPASKAYSKKDERRNFAFAIFNSIKNDKRTKAKKVNFLKPYENLFKSKNFSSLLSENLAKDGLTFIGKDLNNMEIKIKM